MTAPQALLQRAVRWKVRLMSGQATPQDHAQLLRWRQEAPAHEQAWLAVEASLAQELGALQSVVRRHASQADAVRAVLGARAPRRRDMLLGVAGGGIAAASLAIALCHEGQHQGGLADAATAVGERRTVALPDGSRIELDARSAVDLAVGPARRALWLERGRLCAEVAAGDAALRLRLGACTAEVAPGQTATLLAARQSGRATVACLHGALALQAHGCRWPLHAGDGRHIDDGRAPAAMEPGQVRAAAAWRRGMVEALDEPLGEVVEQLRAYHAGWIRVSGRAAALRIQGVWPLGEPLHTLEVIARTLPIAVRSYGSWLVTIDTAEM
ncbi:FecR family protein [Xylophilus sp.]|uniref:FecR family protein n=1 Tax=Xylophilus sp. TaxID=2653893 RepID=UPI0013BAE29E|nr:FecR domain-containing protein [Xylophilus sp.]KAF1050222.1 MAG: Protein FecR [Xylophilus sp.]